MIIKYIDRFQANAPNLRSKEIFLPKQLEKKSQILTAPPGMAKRSPTGEKHKWFTYQNWWLQECVYLCHMMFHISSFLLGELPLRDLLKWTCWPCFSWEIPVEMLCDIIFGMSIECIGCWNMCSFDYLIEAFFLPLGTGCYKGQCLTKGGQNEWNHETV